MDLAERLGFDRPRKIRELIERSREELEAFSALAPRHAAGVFLELLGSLS